MVFTALGEYFAQGVSHDDASPAPIGREIGLGFHKRFALGLARWTLPRQEMPGFPPSSWHLSRSLNLSRPFRSTWSMPVLSAPCFWKVRTAKIGRALWP